MENTRWRRTYAAAGRVSLVLAACVPVGGCNTPWPYIGAAAGAAIVGGQAPTNEIHQVYYLGVFDPQEQLPPTVYRITVHGQGSFISRTKFASGWVPASVVDTLNEKIGIDDDGTLKVEAADASGVAGIKTGRALMMFGPEGFREAPRDHRLVIVMGSNPSAFFKAVGETLGAVGEGRQERAQEKARVVILEELIRMRDQRDALRDWGATWRASDEAGLGSEGGAAGVERDRPCPLRVRRDHH